MDERQQVTAGKAALITLALICLGSLGFLAWEYLRTGEVTNTPAVLILVGSAGLFALIQRMFGAQAPPRSVLGRELPTGPSPQERRIRRRSYALDALLFSAAIAVLSGIGLLIGDASAIDAIPLPLAGFAGAVLGAVLAGLIGFVTFYTLNYVIGESESRAVERRLARLERQSS